MKVQISIILLLLISNVNIGQTNLSIVECLKLDGFNFRDFNQADRFPKDTLIDIKNGYYEINDGETKLLQATKFNNSDGTIMIAATGYYADMQCYNYFSKFYSKTDTSLVEMHTEDVMPEFKFSDFFIDATIREVAQKYLPTIQQEYFPNATLENVYEEFFDIHYILPRYGTKVIAKLTVCDYIPLNEVNIDEEDWKVVETRHESIALAYNKKKRVFVVD